MTDQDRTGVNEPGAEYESPQIEDLENPEGPSVTAAGTSTQVPAAPRDLG